MSARRRSNVRLYVVGFVFVAVTGVLWARLVQVQFVRHDRYALAAEKQRVQFRKIPATRGEIFDREGRPLALNARHYAVGVIPARVTSVDAVADGVARALHLSRDHIYRRTRSNHSFFYVARQRDLDEDTRARLKNIKGVSVLEEPGRVYPYGAVGAKLIGFVGYDNDGRAGIEVACERDLSGVPGRERVVRNGLYDTDLYHCVTVRKPADGKHVYLTIDAPVQEIAEVEVERAVRDNGANSGAIIVMDVTTGDILALAEYPRPESRRPSSRADSLWTIRSLSHVYEPGSTFKLVTAAALLESGGVEPDDVFDAEGGRANLGHSIISDPHPHDRITFREAFAYSSNVVMAKASRLVSADDFYRTIRLFGFGAKTGVLMTGESSGSVSDVASWSGRTQTTMAFGQEIAVTPLQMLCAYAAVANDGVMMMPRLILGVADEATGEITRARPVKVRRVVSRETADTLRSFCLDVVEYGTGTKGAPGTIRVAGKTGTGQKASPRGGYLPGKYVASFVGFAPYEDPRIACIVLIDEPRWASRYGGESAAPVFARVCRSLANSTHVFDGALAGDVVASAPEHSRRFSTPNFLRMDRAAALEYARRLGANVLCQGDDGRVVSQNPSPGARMDRDGVIRLTVAGAGGTHRGRQAPDLRGMTMRRAKQLAAEHGFMARFVGSGVVTRQSPGPGRKTGYEYMKLYCDASGSGRGGGSR